jgi:DNA-binding MarR family transcriptional regulator/GNAT superfamily N-acetyltransferase
MNLIQKLGYLSLGTRFRILTDKLLQDVDKVYKNLDIDFEPRWFTVFYLINERGPITVTEIAGELNYTQPAVTQIINILTEKGLVKAVKEKEDSRKKILTITSKGKKLYDQLSPVWEIIENTVKEFFLATGYDILTILEKIETGFNEKDIYSRINEKIRIFEQGGIKIIHYNDKYKHHFRDLNYDWIRKYFKIEDIDREMLENPQTEIIDKGGSIFFALKDDEVVGTAALIRHPDGSYELTKMAVDEKYRGKKAGYKLAHAVIEKANELNAGELFLETNTSLSPAMSLYRKLGFEEIGYNQPSKYERSTIRMNLDLNKYFTATKESLIESN